MPPPAQRRNLLIVVSAPSGAGKTTLCDRLLAERDDIVYSVSCTTRQPRGREVHGEDYFFLSPDEFDRRVRCGQFLEHALVHGHRYGTLRSTVVDALASSRSVLMDIDVQGAAQIRKAIALSPPTDPLRRGFVDIFIEPPSLEILKNRLEGRREDQPAEIARRLRNAELEMTRAGDYQYRIVNDDLDRAFAELKQILEKEQGRSAPAPAHA